MNKKAENGILRVQQRYREHLVDLISVLESDPMPYTSHDVAKIQGGEDAYRVRIGDILGDLPH